MDQTLDGPTAAVALIHHHTAALSRVGLNVGRWAKAIAGKTVERAERSAA